jgi:hypothetical protein
VSERPEQASEDAALYVNERELHRRINPMLAFDRFRAVVREAELRSFPKISASWGGRYWPAVKVWLDAENGIGANDHAVTDAQDGPETFHASTRQGPGSQTRPPQSAVLDRDAGRARHHGLPRQVHPAPVRR